MTLSAKVLNDLATLVRGYKAHIAYAQTLADGGSSDVLGDGLTAADSVQAHLGYVDELEAFVANEGVKAVEEVAAEIIQEILPEEAPKPDVVA